MNVHELKVFFFLGRFFFQWLMKLDFTNYISNIDNIKLKHQEIYNFKKKTVS